MSQYKAFLNQFKRKQPGSSSSSSDTDSPVTVKSASKRLCEDSQPDEMDKQMSSFMTDVTQRLADLQTNLASKDDIRKLKTDIQKDMDCLATGISDKLESMDERISKAEKERDELREEMTAMKTVNADLLRRLGSQHNQLSTLRRTHNDAEQHGRQWNIRVFNIAEVKPEETEGSASCVEKVCDVITRMVGVTLNSSHIEIAHRVGPRSPQRNKPRAIIVRFHSRIKKEEVMSKRRQLKGNSKKIAIAEDLTPLNYKLLTAARQHSATIEAWSSNGKIITKLKNGKTLKLNIGENIDDVLKRHM